MAEHKHEDLRRIFDLAIAISPDQRAALLDRLCGGDAGLKRRIEAMIAAAEDEQFLSSPTEAPSAPLDPHATMNGAGDGSKAPVMGEGPGTRIGPYKILQLIGEGGFGSVFMAEQEKPVARKVALKIIKLGMDTRAVIARFEAERQALAMMDHPNIARVLDAGATEAGRPYFVMDLVKGDPIGEYCDKQNLSITDRLELFSQVCNAVQHAHTKGIIHRDIKPSNILVSTQDGRPAAKVIDFGIAKATANKLTEKTLFTEHRQLIGTPEYMSPEQAEGSMDIDTRTDVYSLGVLLYELLTGSTPFDAKSLRSAAFAEIQRIIREVDPPNPSTRLSQNSETIASVAARRQSEPRKLGMIVRGELDWIVMKALEKDRQRRYGAASALAMDVQRYLAGDAVTAAPPSAAYRSKKFLRRHKGPVIACAAVAAALLAGIIGIAWQVQMTRRERDVAVRARVAEENQRSFAEDQRKAAEAQRAAALAEAARASALNNFMEQVISSADPESNGARDITMAEVLSKASLDAHRELKDQPQLEASARTLLGNTFRSLGKIKESEAELQRALTLREQGGESNSIGHAETLRSMGLTLQDKGEEEGALKMFTRARELFLPLGESRSREIILAHVDVARTQAHLSQYAQAENTLQEADKAIEKFGRSDPALLADMASVKSHLATAWKGDPTLAESLMSDEVVFRRQANQPAILASSLSNLAVTKTNRGKLDEALELFDEAIKTAKHEYGDKHQLVAAFMENQANVYRMKKDYDKCLALMTEVLAIRESLFGRESLPVAKSQLNLGAIAITKKDYKFGLEQTEAVLPLLRKLEGEQHIDVAQALRNRAMCLKGLNDPAGALRDNQAALAIYDAVSGPTAIVRLRTLLAILDLQCEQGMFEGAEATANTALKVLDSGIAAQAGWIKDFQEHLAKCREGQPH